MTDAVPPSKPTGPRVLVPESQSPVFLDTPYSQIYRHVHPTLVLSVAYFSFSSLVADPISTLISTAIPLAIFQFLYCILCLPPWSSKPAPSPSSKKDGNGNGNITNNNGGIKDSSTTTTTAKRPKRVQFAKTPATLSSKISPALLSLLFSLALSPPLTLLIILHGASLTTNHAGTFLLALHVVLLTCPPLVYVHGVTDRRMWREILTLSLPMDEMFGGVVGCVLGVWLGQVALPLDWDREWQAWPIPLVVGGYGGWFAGRVVGEWGIKGWRIDFNNSGEGGKLDGE